MANDNEMNTLKVVTEIRYRDLTNPGYVEPQLPEITCARVKFSDGSEAYVPARELNLGLHRDAFIIRLDCRVQADMRTEAIRHIHA